jgi:hypothetical protein
MTDFNPQAIATIGHNAPPAEYEIFTEINDLYETAKDFCDGDAIASQETADAITKIMEYLHDAGKRADAMRVTEKKPHDDAAKAVQDKYNPYVQKDKGKVDKGKSACAALLAPWRTKLAREAAELAAAIRAEAERKTAEAQAAIQASAGNLAEREVAEYAAKEAKALTAQAKKAEAAPTGLVTKWIAVMENASEAIEWAYGRDPKRFNELAQSMADEAVRGGMRAVSGFVIKEEMRARV